MTPPSPSTRTGTASTYTSGTLARTSSRSSGDSQPMDVWVVVMSMSLTDEESGRHARRRSRATRRSAGVALVPGGDGEAAVGAAGAGAARHHLVDLVAHRHRRRRSASPSSWAVAAVFTPSATMFIAARISSSVPPGAELLADVAVAAVRADARGDEVAHAGQAGERGGLAAHRHAEAGQLGRARGSSPRPGCCRRRRAPGRCRTAMATTFFSAPPSSQPMTSWLV